MFGIIIFSLFSSNTYWAKRGIKGPFHLPIIGIFHRVVLTPFLTSIEKGSIDYETLSKLPYLDGVISETLRKYPPVVRLNRVAWQKCRLGNTGITLEKGSVVNILVYAMHHNEQFFPLPDKFKPERFLLENRHQILPYGYLPFGIGPRNCIGMRFGLLEAKLALAKIITKYKFVKSKNAKVPLEFLPNRGLLTPKSIIIGVERR